MGNWDAAWELLSRNENLIRTAITEGGEIALHVAAVEGHEIFVTKLLENIEIDDMETLALHYALLQLLDTLKLLKLCYKNTQIWQILRVRMVFGRSIWLHC